MKHAKPTETNLSLPQDSINDPREAAKREWLVTNGLGGFASGTVAGCLTRRYHALLVAAIEPPVVRRVTWAKAEERLFVGGREFRLFTNLWKSGIEEPAGCRLLSHFSVELGVPTWCFENPEFRVWKRIFMQPGRNSTYVHYFLDHAAGPAELEITALVDDRDYHHLPRADGRSFNVTADTFPAKKVRGKESTKANSGGIGRLLVKAGDGSPALTMIAPGEWQTESVWFRDFLLSVERDRGYDHLADYFCAGRIRFPIASKSSSSIVASTEPADAIDPEGDAILAAVRERHGCLIDDAGVTSAALEIRQLALAADQFIVLRPATAHDKNRPNAPEQKQTPATSGSGSANRRKRAESTAYKSDALPPHGTDGKTIIAGYPWFTDWGRDTMISLPGLTLSCGRPDIARDILLTFSRHVDRGMLPNRFPDRGDAPDYNTADATLWYFWAVGRYFDATGDRETLARLFPVLEEIVDWHRRGTRFNIHVDDGLLHAGQTGVQLTWMDAKCGDWVVTPRIGKPVELSALWYAAQTGMARFARVLDKPAESFDAGAEQTRRAFARFWNPERNCCFDVLDGPNGHEPQIRPNQIFAVSLAADDPTLRSVETPVGRNRSGRAKSWSAPPLDRWLLPLDRCRAIVDCCERRLLTGVGLRSLDPADPAYIGLYRGGLRERDAAYHQGTVWGWLLGPFAVAHAVTHNNRPRAIAYLTQMLEHLRDSGIGSFSEVFDGDFPHTSNGCPAQAWSVAEVLRAWKYLSA